MLFKKSLLSEKRIQWTIFLVFFLVRILFVTLSGFSSFDLQPDSSRYNRQSDAILLGQYNLLEPLFITAPFYPYFQSLFKLTFGSYWILALQLTQIILSSLSGVFIYKIAKIIWECKEIAIISAILYCFYPFTFWWVHTFTQDTPFQYHLIFTIYFLLKSVYKNHFPSLIFSAILFSITFLTKSHILLFAPIIPLILLFSNQEATFTLKVKNIFIFIIICFVFTIPYGVYNHMVNGVYVISSTGQGGFFLTGHNDDVYKQIVNPPVLGSEEARRLQNLEFSIFEELETKKEGLSHREVQSLFLREGIKWCVENPQKAVTLFGYNLFYFLLPGLNPNWYSFKSWIVSFIISIPIYLLAYIGIFIALKQDFRKHLWVVGLFGSMILFSTIFYVQNRFRVITIEPFYLLYASSLIPSLIFLFKSKWYTLLKN